MNQESLFAEAKSINQPFKLLNDIVIDVKREDLLHPVVSGNKLRKLKYNLKDFEVSDHDRLLTYGGAHSNHIAATAAAGKILNISTIGVIRGEELAKDFTKTLENNRTLRQALDDGMQLRFINREKYKNKYSQDVQSYLVDQFCEFYNIPEGGTNALAVKGTSEILTDHDRNYYDLIAVAAGTGGTAAGIIESSAIDQQVLVFSALKGSWMRDEIQKYTNRSNFIVIPEDIFGGYARSNDVLIDYMNVSFRESGIPLDPIYTAKMLYGLEQLIKHGKISGKTRILAVHTGGLQGVQDYNTMLAQKGRLTIDYADQIL